MHLPATLTRTFTHIDQQRDHFIERLIAYVRQPSISAHGIGIAETAEFLLGRLQALGMEAQLMPTAGWPLVLGKRFDAPGKPTVLLYGHYDVQPPDPLEEWLSPPFEPTIRNGRIYARGVGDNKGQHFAQLLAIESLLATQEKLPCNVIVLLEGEEEIGSPHIADFIRQQGDLLHCDLVVTADGPIHESNRACLMFGVRGVLSFELRARGANTDLHSGNWGGVVPNPIWTLIQLLATMKNSQGHITIDGFYDEVQPPTALEQQALAQLPLDLALIQQELEFQTLDGPIDRPFFERLMFYPTFTINGFHGGYGGPGSKTVLPHEAFVKCDIRLVESMSLERTLARVKAHVARYAPAVEVIVQGGMEPSKTPLESPYTVPILNALRAGQAEEPLLVPSAGGSLPDYVFTKILGVPAFGTPYANPDERNHAPNENMEIERFIKGIKSGAALLTYLGSM
jgi:acetylornithine deacetylase/succinyl-diaminopimelate desuccinylase-like protein